MATPPQPVRSAADRERNRETPRKRLLADKAARWIVSAGGIGIIASILGAEIWGIISDHYGLGRAILLAPSGYLIASFLWAYLAFWQRRYGP